MERPERLVLLISRLFNRLGPVLWVIAVVSTITSFTASYTPAETRAGRTFGDQTVALCEFFLNLRRSMTRRSQIDF